ncbi:MAG: hypothetical protein ABEK10_02895 [Candidatus Nanosalina sp.]
MNKGSLEKEFHGLLDDVVDGVREKLDISEAVERRTSSGTAAAVVSNSSTVQREIIDPEIESYRSDLKKQFSLLLEAVEDGESVEERAEELLEHDMFYQHLEAKDSEVEEKILERFKTLHARMARINSSESEDVWEAVEDEFTRQEAEEFIDEMFGFIEEIEEHRHQMAYRKEVDLSQISKLIPLKVEVDYTPEAFEVMKESEEEVHERLMGKIQEIYGEDDSIKL